MKQALLLASAALAFVAAPAAAQPGHGHGNHSNHGQRYDSRDYGRSVRVGYACPPGLAKKHNGCLPPGIAKKRYNRGQHWARNYYGTRYSYNQIPYDLRNQYRLDRYDNYYYSDGYYYQVDPKTQVIQQVISALLR